MKMTMKTFSALIKTPNERSYLLKFLTSVIVVINYLTTMSVMLLFIKLAVIFLLFRALINITTDDD